MALAKYGDGAGFLGYIVFGFLRLASTPSSLLRLVAGPALIVQGPLGKRPFPQYMLDSKEGDTMHQGRIARKSKKRKRNQGNEAASSINLYITCLLGK